MAKQASKKTMHEADSKGKLIFASPLDMQEHAVDPAPESAMQAKETADGYIARKYASPLTGEYVESAPVPATAPAVEQAEDDTDIGKKINDVIEREYPRTRIGTDGWLQAILCELIRARLSK